LLLLIINIMFLIVNFWQDFYNFKFIFWNKKS
jgi:hypothetical protein